MARILIVDDDELDRMLHQAILERGGHEIHIASNEGTAAREVMARQIQVVVTDLQMPNVHGLELITQLRALEPRPAIVAVSGTGEDQLDMAKMLGADEILEKPVDPRDLLDAVERVVRAEP